MKLTSKNWLEIGNMTREMIAILDENLTIKFSNKQMERDLGFEENELIEKPFLSLFDEHLRENLKKIFKQVWTDKSLLAPFENSICKKDGSHFRVELSINLLSSEETNEPANLVVLLENLTKKHQAELDLKEEKDRLNTILNSIGVGLLITDKDKNVFYANEVITQKFKYSFNEKCYSIFQNDCHCEECVLQKIFAGEDLATTIEKGLDKEGKKVAFEVLASPLRDEEGNLIGVLEIILDVTEKQKLTERVNVLAQVVEQMMEGVALTTPEGKIFYLNQSLANLTGWDRDELTDKSISILYPWVDKVNLFSDSTRSKNIGETKCLKKDNEEFPIILSTFTIEHKEGQPAVQAWVSMDLTERKRLEQDLVQSSKLAALGELISGITHEINNPLTTIMGYAQILLKKFSNSSSFPSLEKVQRDLWTISNEAERTTKIVRNLLTFARKYQPEQNMLSVNEVVESTLSLRSYELKTNNIEIDKELDPNIPLLLADFNQLQQVLLNLINNAAQAMEKMVGQRILTIRTSEINRTIRIQITDTGSGIPEENLKRIFDPFFTTKEVGVGTGLGLSICFGIIKEHGGKILVESEEGKGTTFFVDLPINQTYERQTIEEPSGVFPNMNLERKILIIDDESHIRRIMKENLEEDGHKIVLAANGEDALKKSAAEKFDLIIADIKMPKMNGEEFFEELQNSQPHNTSKVIFVTGDTMNKKTKDFVERSGRPYLFKPFHLDEFKKKVNQVFKESEL